MTNFQKSWSPDEIDDVWRKGEIANGWDQNVYRLDTCGAIIKKDMYGNIQNETNYGWEIDHILPESLGGSDDLSNLRPLQWSNNRAKADNLDGNWKPTVQAVHDSNGWHNELK